MKYQLGTYQTTEGKIEITRINLSLPSSKPYYVTYLSDLNYPKAWISEKTLDLIIIREEPEPLENWKHPYFGQPILVRDDEAQEWKKEIFKGYNPDSEYPVSTTRHYYKLYKFPEPSIQMTTAELLALAKEVKGINVELK